MITRNPATMPSMVTQEAPDVIDPMQPRYIMYGYLYNYYAAMSNIAPSGWKVPTGEDYNQLRTYLGTTNVGRALKSERTFGRNTQIHPAWQNHGTNFGTDLYNFLAIPAGFRLSTGGFVRLSTDLFLGTQSDVGIDRFFVYVMRHDSASFGRAEAVKKSGVSIRLLRTTAAGQPGDGAGDGDYCPGLTDIDGNVYNTVRIGTQVWTAQNLATTRYANGTPIPNVTSNDTWAVLTTGARCAYENNENYVFTNLNWI